MKKEHSLFDVLASLEMINKGISFANKELDNPPRVDGLPRYHRCNVCDFLFSESEMVEDDELGFLCKSCSDGQEELDQEQEDIEETFRQEKREKIKNSSI